MDDGVGNGSSFASAANANRYGFYDLSGNITQWVPDQAGPAQQALRGGSFRDPASELAGTYRAALPRDVARDDVGFRIVQRVPTPLWPQVPVSRP